MESNWRYWVYDSGWQNSTLELVARLNTPWEGSTAVCRVNLGLFYTFGFGLILESGYVEGWGFGPTSVDGDWPFYLDVLPDHPALPWV